MKQAGKHDHPVQKSEAEWRKELSPEQFRIMFEHATERPGTSPLLQEKRAGTFICAACGQPAYSADAKYESGSGWPSFWEPLEGATETQTDRSLFMTRVEVHCANCGAHQGHVFDDGPEPTGQRYCINGLALKFKPEE